MEKTETVQQLTCLRCGHVWLPRFFKRPGVCPICKSYGWDTPRKADRSPSVAPVGNGQHE